MTHIRHQRKVTAHNGALVRADTTRHVNPTREAVGRYSLQVNPGQPVCRPDRVQYTLSPTRRQRGGLKVGTRHTPSESGAIKSTQGVRRAVISAGHEPDFEVITVTGGAKQEVANDHHGALLSRPPPPP